MSKLDGLKAVFVEAREQGKQYKAFNRTQKVDSRPVRDLNKRQVEALAEAASDQETDVAALIEAIREQIQFACEMMDLPYQGHRRNLIDLSWEYQELRRVLQAQIDRLLDDQLYKHLKRPKDLNLVREGLMRKIEQLEYVVRELKSAIDDDDGDYDDFRYAERCREQIAALKRVIEKIEEAEIKLLLKAGEGVPLRHGILQERVSFLKGCLNGHNQIAEEEPRYTMHIGVGIELGEAEEELKRSAEKYRSAGLSWIEC